MRTNGNLSSGSKSGQQWYGKKCSRCFCIPEKYPSELEAALSEYAALKEQGADFDSTELYAQRMELRSEKNISATQRIQHAYGEKYGPLVMLDSKRDVAELLHEDAEARAYYKVQKQQKQQGKNTQKEKHRYSQAGAIIIAPACHCITKFFQIIDSLLRHTASEWYNLNLPQKWLHLQ